MGFAFGILVLFAIFLGIGAFLGWVAISRISRVDDAVARIDARLMKAESRIHILARKQTEAIPQPAPEQDTPKQGRQEQAPGPAALEVPKPSPAVSPGPSAEPPTPGAAEVARVAETEAPTADEETFTARVIDNIRRNWMAWLGGVSVALAGIFLVSYSIEMGWLGPRTRIILAIITGLVLHAAAEWFRRRTQTSHPAFAAMAGGASITLYAALFAALELYEFLSPVATFALLAIVALLTMALATVHGPVLAIMGLLGAYIVPILISQHGGGSLIELVYSLIVTTAALFLIRFVYRSWLWAGIVVGAFAWWLLTLSSGDADGYLGLYLAAIAYLLLAIPTLDWTVTRVAQVGDPATENIDVAENHRLEPIQVTMALIVFAQTISIIDQGFDSAGSALVQWAPLIALLIWASRARASLHLAPWMLLATSLVAWLIPALDGTGSGVVLSGIAEELQTGFLAFAFLMSVLFSVGTLIARQGKSFNHVDASLIWLSPVLWLALSYLLVTDLSVAWEWGVGTLVLGLGYIFVAGRKLEDSSTDGNALWLIIAGHTAYSLAAAMLFREATLTLGLAAQVISLAWLNRRYALPAIDWIIKAVLAGVVIRLTLNPWLLEYPVDVHWSLWTYGGSMLCCFVGARLTNESQPTRKWLEASTLHLLVLFLGAELRYWLYDGQIFVEEFTLTEAGINTVIWGGLGLSYYNRRRSSELLAGFYAVCSQVLVLLAVASYALALVVLNPLWGNEPVSSTPIWNILLLAYGAPVLLALGFWRFFDPAFRHAALAVAGAGLFILVTLEIRHLWHGALDIALGSRDGERYTYSAVWLVMAVMTMLGSTRLGADVGYKAGMGLLLVVIGKIFVLDMAGLEGLLRVASFMGLGLALLGLAWLYQRTARPGATSTR